MNKLFLLTCLISTVTFGQIDFNNYITLQSAGKIPEEFTKTTYEKLEETKSDRNSNLNGSSERVFYEGINYAVDDLIHSGYVTFGDPISVYVGEIADKLLRKDKKLREELSFYVIKANAANAFSTEQGIVFITTGLIAQLTNEAQLAFILAHEISHYQEHHVLESFEYHSTNRTESIDQMSIYSKEKELEADKIGMKMYAEAGYSKEELLPTFDVLLYSYLPFDEIAISLDYFRSSDSLYVPNNLFPSERYEIKAIEDEDDSRSSHPNIKRRKEEMLEAIKEQKNWGTTVQYLGEERFNEIRTIARFEVVRNNILDAEYGNALYSIYLLERDYPESMYLKRMKTHSWLGILQYACDMEGVKNIVMRSSDLEGESASVHYFIREMSRDQVITMAVRQLDDLYTANSEDEEIGLIYKRMAKTLANSTRFDLNDYAAYSFHTAAERFVATQQVTEENEEGTEEPEEDKKLNKYDRIKKTKDVNNPENFDSTEFHLYLIPDVISDSLFLDYYDQYADEKKQADEAEEAFKKLTRKERQAYLIQEEKDALKLGINEVIVVEPTVLSFRSSGLDRVKSEKLEEQVTDVIETASKENGISAYSISSSKLSGGGTVMFNERATLMRFLEQMASNTDIDAFPVDYTLLKNLEENYGTSNVMFTSVTHTYMPNIGFDAVYAIVFYPIAFIYFPLKFASGHETEINMVLFDSREGKVIGMMNRSIRVTPRKHTLGSHFYNLFNTLNTQK